MSAILKLSAGVRWWKTEKPLKVLLGQWMKVTGYQRTLTQDFTLSMFARLCLILRDDDAARPAHNGSGQPSTKQQQQNRVSRDDFWNTVAERFNDASPRP